MIGHLLKGLIAYRTALSLSTGRSIYIGNVIKHRNNFFSRLQDVIAYHAFYTSRNVPFIRTGRFELTCHLRLAGSMSESGNVHGLGAVIAANHTGMSVTDPAVGYAVGINLARNLLYLGVTERGSNDAIYRKLLFTYRTVGYVIIGRVKSTGWIAYPTLVIGNHRLAGSMTERGDLNLRNVDLTAVSTAAALSIAYRIAGGLDRIKDLNAVSDRGVYYGVAS